MPVVGEDLVFFDVLQAVPIAGGGRLPRAAGVLRAFDDAVVERNPDGNRHTAQPLGSATAKEKDMGPVATMVATATAGNALRCARKGALEGVDKCLDGFSGRLAGQC